MSEPIQFEYVNDSLTTMVQSRLISKLACYLKIPVKKMRECLDKEVLKDTGVITFPSLEFDFPSFYAADIPVNVNAFLSEKSFEKSKFLEEYIIFTSKPNTSNVAFVCNCPDFMVMDDYEELDGNDDMGRGGIYFNYRKLDIRDKILYPITTYLNIHYPLPPYQ